MAGALPTILAGTPQTNHDQMAGVPDHPKLAGAPQSKYTLVAGALPTTMGKVRDVRRGVFYWENPVFPAPFSWISPAFTSPPSLSVLSSRQGWGCKCSVLLASPFPGLARPHASSIVPSGGVVVCSSISPTTQSTMVAILRTPSPLHLRLAVAIFTLLHPTTRRSHSFLFSTSLTQVSLSYSVPGTHRSFFSLHLTFIPLSRPLCEIRT
jgi:hypothetical protein